MTNPFGDWELGKLDPAQPVPVPLLVQTAIAGTVDDGGIPDHLQSLLFVLEARGAEAWGEAALVLVGYLNSANHFGSGSEASAAYLEQNMPEGLPASLEAMHTIVAAWISGGREVASRVLQDFPLEEVQGAVRYLLCLASAAAGMPRDRLDGLLNTVVQQR